MPPFKESDVVNEDEVRNDAAELKVSSAVFFKIIRRRQE